MNNIYDLVFVENVRRNVVPAKNWEIFSSPSLSIMCLRKHYLLSRSGFFRNGRARRFHAAVRFRSKCSSRLESYCVRFCFGPFSPRSIRAPDQNVFFSGGFNHHVSCAETARRTETGLPANHRARTVCRTTRRGPRGVWGGEALVKASRAQQMLCTRQRNGRANGNGTENRVYCGRNPVYGAGDRY